MNILVTGFSGNLGSALVEKLHAEGHDLRLLLHGKAFDRTSFPFQKAVVWGSMAQFDLFDQLTQGVDAVVHCAWDSRATSREDSERINLEGTIRLLQAAARNGVQSFIHISSVAVYGLNRSLWGQVLDEQQSFVSSADALDDYPRVKVLIEEKCRQMKDSLDINLMIVRPGLLFSDEKPPAKKLARIKNKKGVGLIVGSGKNHLPYVHVKDVASMIHILLQRPVKYAVYNAVPSEHVSVESFLRRWGRTQGLSLKVMKIPPPCLRMAAWGVRMLKRMMGKRHQGRVDYQIATGIRNIKYSADKARRELSWIDEETREIALRDV